MTEKITNDTEQQNVSVKNGASSSRTPVATTMATAEKPGKFTGIDFKRWQQKMFFYLTTLSLQRFINEDVPVLESGTPDNEIFVVTEAWKHSDFLCKNYIHNGLEDALYNVLVFVKLQKNFGIL